MLSQPYAFYNETFVSPTSPVIVSLPEHRLMEHLRQFMEVKLTDEHEQLITLKDLWNLKFYVGTDVIPYVNERAASEVAKLLDFSKVLVVSEFKQKDIGIRYYASLPTDEIVVDIVCYCDPNKTGPGDRASMERRIWGPWDTILSLKYLSVLLNISQELSESLTKAKTIVCN